MQPQDTSSDLTAKLTLDLPNAAVSNTKVRYRFNGVEASTDLTYIDFFVKIIDAVCTLTLPSTLNS